MRDRLLVYMMILITAAACSERKVPKGILEPEKMEAVVWDMIRAGEMLNGFVLYRDTFTNAVQESQRWYQKIYDLHGTTKEAFIRSYQYYREHPDLSRALFDSLASYEEKKELVDTSAHAPVDTALADRDTLPLPEKAAGLSSDSFGNRRYIDLDTARLRKRKQAKGGVDRNIPVN